MRYRRRPVPADQQTSCHTPPGGDPDAALSALVVSLHLAVPREGRPWPPDWSTFTARWADACTHVRNAYADSPPAEAQG